MSSDEVKKPSATLYVMSQKSHYILFNAYDFWRNFLYACANDVVFCNHFE